MPTDQNLIHQTLKGNPRAFDTLVQKYQPVVYAGRGLSYRIRTMPKI